MTHTLRTLSPSYITKAFQLIQNEGWTVSELEFRSLLAYSGTQAFMAVVQDEIIGMIVAIAYDTFGFLGNLIVSPNYRRQGLGTQFLHHAISTVSKNKISMIMLDAVPQAVPLYQRMGFLPVCKSLRFRGKFKH